MIQVGQGVTYGIGSDRYPYTVVEVSENQKTIVIQSDNAEIGPNYDYYKNQNWIITPNPNGVKETFTLRKRGVWVKKGCAKASGYISFNGRSKYQDPCF